MCKWKSSQAIVPILWMYAKNVSTSANYLICTKLGQEMTPSFPKEQLSCSPFCWPWTCFSLVATDIAYHCQTSIHSEQHPHCHHHSETRQPRTYQSTNNMNKRHLSVLNSARSEIWPQNGTSRWVSRYRWKVSIQFHHRCLLRQNTRL